jgi:lysophospholipase-3
MTMPDLTVGQVGDLNLFLLRDGDGNQEDITNDSIQVWENMACFRFELTNTPDTGDPANVVNHFTLPSLPAVLQRLLTNLQRPKSVCP